MKTNQSLLQRHPLFSYFALAYAITWGGILIFLASIGFQFSAIQMQEGLIIFGLMILGPSASGLIMTAVMEGRAGLGRAVAAHDPLAGGRALVRSRPADQSITVAITC